MNLPATQTIFPSIRRRPDMYERLASQYGELLSYIQGENPSGGGREAAPPSSPRQRLRWTKRLSSRELTADESKHVASAFRILSATRSADKEGDDSLTAVAIREDSFAFTIAREWESTVASLIRTIGEIVIESQQSVNDSALRDDEIFEYFCEKSMLQLFAYIVREKPGRALDHTAYFQGVVWSPRVKAQVLKTISTLVSNLRDRSALYYMLSQHSINQLIVHLLPLQQWTDQALTIMIPVYIELLKNLTLQLGAQPHLFPFFTIDNTVSGTVFPLFSALLETVASHFAQTNSYSHATCLNLIVGLMQLEYEPAEIWIRGATKDQYLLANHLCELLLRRYYKIASLCTGPVVDSVRADAIVGQISGLRDEIQVLNDIFLCSTFTGIRVRTCETLLRKFTAPILHHLHPEALFGVGNNDSDVIPEREAHAHAAVLVFVQLFSHVDYNPFLRMLAVALFHPLTTPCWRQQAVEEEYGFTQALNSLVSHSGEDIDNYAVTNPYRIEILKSIEGVYGEWRIASAALLLEKLVSCQATDDALLSRLAFWGHETTNLGAAVVRDGSSLEAALEHLPRWQFPLTNPNSMPALKCTTAMLLQCIRRLDKTKDKAILLRLEFLLNQTKDLFFRRLLSTRESISVADIFVDVIEDVVQSLYRRHTLPGGRQGFAFVWSIQGSSPLMNGSDMLIRKLRSVSASEVEQCRCLAEISLYLRAVCRIVKRLIHPTSNQILLLDTADDELQGIFPCLQSVSVQGTAIDTRGRMTFAFTSLLDNLMDTTSSKSNVKPNKTPPSTANTTTNDRFFRTSSATLTLVLDPTILFIVQAPSTKERPVDDSKLAMNTRGVVICAIPLLRVIATAADGDTLHVAVHHPDVPGFIQNGNLAFHFPSSGTSLVVQRYLDRSRQLLRKELSGKIVKLFSASAHNKHCS